MIFDCKLTSPPSFSPIGYLNSKSGLSNLIVTDGFESKNSNSCC